MPEGGAIKPLLRSSRHIPTQPSAHAEGTHTPRKAAPGREAHSHASLNDSLARAACRGGKRPPKPTDNALIRTLCAQIREQNQEIAALRIANTDLLQRLEKAEGGRA
ncbi:hypothetical protein [Pseudomonas aeruginosa]|uniref:hypothetical protein n=1 Tax=Pseudomonas aeruginosa TaxID=287 RepID=UPI0035269DF7